MFSDTLKYWTDRKKRFGDKCVGHVGEDHVRQGTIIGAELTKVLTGFYTHGLDFGCGYGRFTQQIASKCGHVWAADLFGDWVGRAANNRKTVTPVTLNTFQLPFDDGTFDLVVDIMTMQSINAAKDRETVSRELARVTAVGGTIVTMNKESVAREESFLSDLGIGNPIWSDIDHVDKNRDVYCLIRGTRL